MKILMLLIMLFLHIVDDYYLQGILAKLKQKSWWEENAPDPLYKNDYKVALIEHGFSWIFMVMLPWTCMMLFKNDYSTLPAYLVMFAGHWYVHSITDNMKANLHVCNLVVDQIIHVCQVICIWLFVIYAWG